MSLERVVRSRIDHCTRDIRYSLDAIRRNNPFAAEPSAERRQRRFQSKMNLSHRDAEALDAEVQRRATRAAPERRSRAPVTTATMTGDAREAIWGDTVDFVSVAFLERGARVAHSVGRVAYKSGHPKGTGVLIGAGLFLTNNHVIENEGQADESLIEFDYERDLYGSLREPTRFAIDRSVFISDPVNGLDFTIFAIGPRWDGKGRLPEFDRTQLSDAGDKHMIGEFANIIQHPQGRFKEVVLRENRLVNRFEDALHYVADTEPGSSGSPVYNSEWKLIALHHWGGPWIDSAPVHAPGNFEINEGIRASSIVRKLRQRMPGLSPEVQARVREALTFDDTVEAQLRAARSSAPAENRVTTDGGVSVRIDPDGRATWTLPIEVSVQLPTAAAAVASARTDTAAMPAPPPPPLPPAGEANDTYSDRKGYLPDFLPGFHVPLPRLGPGLEADAARLLDPVPGANPFELKYHHFSVLMNKRRKLSFFTACMIDGATAKSIVRSTRAVTDLSPTDSGLREAVATLDAAEADSWSIDTRISRDDYSGDEIYKGQKVPGFPNPNAAARIARMFQKGHLVRRLDPAWGDETRALAAELDTFHWTNAAPQVGFFNQGTADEDQPGTGGGKLWRAAENYVLRNAVAEDQRVVSFTGPVFSDDDRPYRDIQVPGRFFKVTAWVEGGVLRSLALLVDQAQVFDAWPEGLGTPEYLAGATEAEAFMDTDELSRVTDFLSTVAEVEALTELDFGDALRAADIRRTEPQVAVTADTDLPLSPGGQPPPGIPGALPAPDGTPDDLSDIKGIGKALKRLLNENGIFHFAQIAAWGPAGIDAVGALLRFPGRIERDDWVGQARRLMR